MATTRSSQLRHNTSSHLTDSMPDHPKTINFTRGVPADESFPVDDVINAAIAALQTKGPAMLQYGPSLGFQPLREWLANWHGVSIDRILTGNGSLQLTEFLCLPMLLDGDRVFTQ